MKPWTTRISLTVVVALATVALFGVAGCGGSGQGSETTTTVSEGSGTTRTTATTGRTFTLDELAQFDGKDGAPAYVAVDGLVYDVTGSRMWPDGQHSRCDLGAMAGKDLSEVIKQAPANMRSNLARLPVVGTLSQ